MSPKRGQPPKPPEEKRERVVIFLSPNEKEIVEEARQEEAPDKRTGAYVRDAAVEHCKKIVYKKK